MNVRRLVLLTILTLCWTVTARAEPAMFWFNDPVGPDETVLVTGADLNEVTSVTVSRIAEKQPPKPEQPTPVEALQVNPQSLKFVIPKDFAPGIYRFTLAHAKGTLTGRVNLPTVYWIQGDLGEAASPGGSIRVFGRNVVRQPDRALLELVPDAGGAAVKVALAKGDLWRGEFRLPDRIAPGRYRLRLANGDGGNEDSVNAGSVTIRAPTPAPAQTFDVRAYGAMGDGRADSTRAIRSAIDAAKDAGGGIVYLPRGRYLVSDALVIPPGVSIRGERTDLVNLVWPDFQNPPISLLQGGSRFSVEDLTIYASNHLHVISGGFALRDTPVPDAADITIRRVRIRASAYRGQMGLEATIQRMRDFYRLLPDIGAADTVRLSGARVEMTDCDIVGSGNSLRLFKATDAVVSGNTLVGGRFGSYFLVGSNRVIFENNVVTAGDLQSTGGGINTLSRWVSASENIYVGGNSFKAIYGLDREAMTSDGPAGYYFGHAQSGTPTSLSLPDAPNAYPAAMSWVGAMVMVVNGRGAGQYARIRAADGAPPKMSVTLDRPLQVELDPTSEVTIVQAQENYLVIDNSFEDTGVAVQAFGVALGHVFAMNRANRTSGFAVIGLSYGHFQPCWRIQILDNHIIDGNAYRAGPDREVFSNESYIFVRANQTGNTPGRPPLVQAVIVRGNKLDHDAHIRIEGFSPASPGVRDVVVEANDTGPSRVGMVVDRGVASSLARRNVEAPRIGR